MTNQRRRRLLVAGGAALGAAGLGASGARPRRAWTAPAGRAWAAPAVLPGATSGGSVRSLFDGRSLGGWKPAKFGGEGAVRVDKGQIVLAKGIELSGITWAGGDIPRVGYEIALQAMKLDGDDFFCGLTFPVGPASCSFIVGGWGGTVVGLSSIDGQDASENQTTTYMNFPKKRWYRIRVRVTAPKIEAWIDDKQVVDLVTTGRQISIRPEVELSKPLGIATWMTSAALRDIKIHLLDRQVGGTISP